MNLEDALTIVTRFGYDRSAPKTQAAQQALYGLRRDPPEGLPVGLVVRVSGQGINLPVVPWITLLDPGVTKKVTEGLYLVYLYSVDLATVYLTMNQGATAHKELHRELGLSEAAAERAAIDELQQEGAAIRRVLIEDFGDVPQDTVSLGSQLFLPRAYEAGSMASRAYKVDGLPSEEQLRLDLNLFNQVYQRAVAVKDQLVASDPSRYRTGSRPRSSGSPVEREPIFRPKDGSEYVVRLEARRRIVRPRHEALIRGFGEVVAECGWAPATNVHPRDMTIIRGDDKWLVEAKTVGLNAEFAVRDAIGQLFAYRHFYYRELGKDDPKLLALFSEAVGEAFLRLLEDLGIEAAWATPGGWDATDGAMGLITGGL